MLDVEDHSGVTVLRLAHGKVNALDLARAMMRVPPDVFSFTKRQLQQPAGERIAAQLGDEEAVLATWASARTRQAIAAYLSTPGKPA